MKQNFSWWRSLLAIASVGLIISFLLPLLDRLIQLYQLISNISPILGGAVVILVIGLVLGLTWLGARYFGLFQKEAAPRPIPEVPTDKIEAAQDSLEALEQQVQQIQDEVMRRSLMEQTEALKQNFIRSELRVVVFGVGSAGKTSLVNGLLDLATTTEQPQNRGQVGATMGTTAFGKTYPPVKFANLDVPIQFIDCPGILEASALGSDREQEARQLATEADLIIFVVDDDLRRSEFEVLQALTQIGKRTVLAFNKIDRLTANDRDIIHTNLRSRVLELIQPQDVVAIAASPAPITLDNGEIITPKSKIQPLITRILDILSYEGDELVADNVLLRSQSLTAATREAIAQQQEAAANQVVEKFQWLVVGVVFATPLPVVDLLATAAINAQMVVEIGKVYGCDINIERGKELANSLTRTLVSLGIVKGVVQIISAAISVTVVGLVVKSTVQSITAAYLTRIAGKSFMEYFSRDRDWGDGGIAEVVQRQFQLNRRDEFLKLFIQDAINRVRELVKVEGN
ncbi:MAG: GTP-binding protein [Pseudanabaenaceae cyanobacterium bins.39]|nr:GTP-binding protein [Pseudanabaenaceae cyanobacterium bins.39]